MTDEKKPDAATKGAARRRALHRIEQALADLEQGRTETARLHLKNGLADLAEADKD